MTLSRLSKLSLVNDKAFYISSKEVNYFILILWGRGMKGENMNNIRGSVLCHSDLSVSNNLVSEVLELDTLAVGDADCISLSCKVAFI